MIRSAHPHGYIRSPKMIRSAHPHGLIRSPTILVERIVRSGGSESIHGGDHLGAVDLSTGVSRSYHLRGAKLSTGVSGSYHLGAVNQTSIDRFTPTDSPVGLTDGPVTCLTTLSLVSTCTPLNVPTHTQAHGWTGEQVDRCTRTLANRHPGACPTSTLMGHTVPQSFLIATK